MILCMGFLMPRLRLARALFLLMERKCLFWLRKSLKSCLGQSLRLMLLLKAQGDLQKRKTARSTSRQERKGFCFLPPEKAETYRRLFAEAMTQRRRAKSLFRMLHAPQTALSRLWMSWKRNLALNPDL